LKGDNSRVNTVNRNVRKVSISYKLRLVSPIVLDIINEMDSNRFEALWNVDTFALIMEAVVVIELDHFKTGGINPLCSIMFLIQFDCTLVVPRDFESIHVFWKMEAVVVVKLDHFKTGGINPLCSTILFVQFYCMLVGDFESILVFWGQTEGPELGLVGHAKHVLLASGNGFEALPTSYIQQVVVLGIDGTCDRVISCNSCHGLIGNLPIFPFNTDIVDGSFPHWMILGKGAFMPCNSLEPPYDGVFL
jgi:hypothetical protein